MTQQPELENLKYSPSTLFAPLTPTLTLIPAVSIQTALAYTQSLTGFIQQEGGGRCCLTQTNGKMAPGPDAEVKKQVLVELLQQRAVAFIKNLLQQKLTCHENVHVHHSAWNLQKTQRDTRF